MGKLKYLLFISSMIFMCCSCSKQKEAAVVPKAEIIAESEIFVEPEIDLLMVGDVLLHDNVQNSGKLADGTYNYDHLFANVKEDIEAADIAIVNQEVILGGTELGLSGYPAFNGPHEVADAIVDAGFDVVLHATNHTLDKGKKGLLNSGKKRICRKFMMVFL